MIWMSNARVVTGRAAEPERSQWMSPRDTAGQWKGKTLPAPTAIAGAESRQCHTAARIEEVEQSQHHIYPHPIKPHTEVQNKADVSGDVHERTGGTRMS